MFDKDDEKRLIRLLSRNDVVLFLGSGFSFNVKNRLDNNFPTGANLSKAIWDFIGFDGDYDGTSLTEMYQAFVTCPRKKAEKKDFLEKQLLSSPTGIPEFYDSVAVPYWYKIYTLNIDDVLDRIYKRVNKQVDTLQYPVHEFKERDQSLGKTQIIHLNGKLPEDPENLIFSNSQYAKASLAHQPLYAQFVYDYAVKTTIFVGTDLNEPIFESYLEAREARMKVKERRPKSYLISPSLGAVKQMNFRDRYNVHYIKGYTEDFLKWLTQISDRLPSKEDILRITFPKLVQMLSIPDLTSAEKESLTAFASGFERVPVDYEVKNVRSAFLLGATPIWNDIFKDLDIPRTITEGIFIEVNNYLKNNENKAIKIINLLGTAGSGKSTILKRLGLRLSQEGHTIFLSYTDYIPNINQIFNALQIIKSKTVLIIDNAENVIGLLPKLITNLNQLDNPPVLILGSRMNTYKKVTRIMQDELDYKSLLLPDLDDQEIHDLIDKLDSNNLLGVIKGYTTLNRFNAFKHTARKQILIALKEVTSGRLFEDIIADEYDKIEPHEAQILCVCVALNTEIGYTNSRQDFVGFSKDSPATALDYLESTLHGTIMWVGNGEKFMIRHRLLAEHIIKICSNLDTLKDAYIRVLSILAPELKNINFASRKFKLYKALINHSSLYNRFHRDIDHAREVYDSVSEFFNDDFQYWLQYGCLELEGSKGNVDLAQNYLGQAESLNGNNQHIQNAMATLYYKKANIETDFQKAIEYKNIADEIANKLFADHGRDNPYIYHIYCKGRFEFLKKWIEDRTDKITELKHLMQRVQGALKAYPFDAKLDELNYNLTRSYFVLGTDGESFDIDIPSRLD
ncbi:SIR2 family protein [Pedobacter sp. MR2016-19]|uniref:P-loop NTPase n=1 Tax=Pedobacter sp. MR2016-19 TaxID=2780089 RepID=UPI001874D2B8|nr:SIR2 family protein [Pedobacter sp. MR2016-19]MBE5319928.1 SIR2 family protein [Pedobacter sp. MR2016-19]